MPRPEAPNPLAARTAPTGAQAPDSEREEPFYFSPEQPHTSAGKGKAASAANCGFAFSECRELRNLYTSSYTLRD